jgi:hypothetical protein
MSQPEQSVRFVFIAVLIDQALVSNCPRQARAAGAARAAGRSRHSS